MKQHTLTHKSHEIAAAAAAAAANRSGDGGEGNGDGAKNHSSGSSSDGRPDSGRWVSVPPLIFKDIPYLNLNPN